MNDKPPLVNGALSQRFSQLWPARVADAGFSYEARVLSVTAGQSRITDVGAGRRTPFASALEPGCQILGIDLLAEDLAANPALSERVTTDVARCGLPAAANGSDVVCSHFVLEHLPDLDGFAREAYRSLRPGGVTVHLFVGRWSPFAILNRLLPERAARRLLFALRPESREVGGFTTHYNHTDPKAARQAFRRAGFNDVDTTLSWEVSQYCRWCFPLFVLARAWESVACRFRIETVASYVLLTSHKPSASS